MESRVRSAEHDETGAIIAIEMAGQNDARVDLETEQDDVLAERWAEDDYQLKQELDREQSGAQLMAEAEIEHQEWLTGEEEKAWMAEHEKPDIEEEEENVFQRVGPIQKTCTKCQKKFTQFFGSTDSIGSYCNECGGLLIDTSEAFAEKEVERVAEEGIRKPVPISREFLSEDSWFIVKLLLVLFVILTFIVGLVTIFTGALKN